MLRRLNRLHTCLTPHIFPLCCVGAWTSPGSVSLLIWFLFLNWQSKFVSGTGWSTVCQPANTGSSSYRRAVVNVKWKMADDAYRMWQSAAEVSVSLWTLEVVFGAIKKDLDREDMTAMQIQAQPVRFPHDNLVISARLQSCITTRGILWK